jgi:hypothetical protein
MIGVFLRNNEDEICFAQLSRDADIASFHYAPAARMIVAVMQDGEEEAITSEIAPEIHEALVKCNRILIALVDEAGEAEKEYWAEVTKA